VSWIFCALGVLVVMAGWPAGAQEPDAQAGLELARDLCTGCHIVGPQRVGSDAAPPFAALARDPEMTLDALHAWPGPNHPVMGDMALTRTQIADINAYLDRLREGASVPAEADEPAEVEREEQRPAIEDAPAERLGEPITPEAEPEGEPGAP